MLFRSGASITGLPVSCSYWPGSYEECIVNIRPDETMIVSEDDMKDPAYTMVPNRTYVYLDGIETLITPAFVHLKDNDNPAVEAFAEFIRSL